MRAHEADLAASANAPGNSLFRASPTPAESQLAQQFLAQGGTLQDFCLAILNRNEFVYVPEAFTWQLLAAPRRAVTRRDVLVRAAHGFGALALASPARCYRRRCGTRVNPLAAKPPHFAAKAKSVIFLFMVGGPSQIDTFDPKPALEKYDGQPLPESYGKVDQPVHQGRHAAAEEPVEVQEVRPVRARGLDAVSASGQCVDDICFVRSSTPTARCTRRRCTR